MPCDSDFKNFKLDLYEFKLETLYSGQQFNINGALVMPQLSDDENRRSHALNVSGLKHFDGVYITVFPDRRPEDISIGQGDKTLLTVLDERESMDPEEPNYVFSRLGPIASGEEY